MEVPRPVANPAQPSWSPGWEAIAEAYLVEVEQRTGNMPTQGEYRRFRLRGLENVNIQAQLIAAGQNLKPLLSRWGWGRRS